jgi:formate-dependent nitrite reductase membrane component NrfD
MNWADINLHPGNRVLRQFAAVWLLVLAAIGLNQWLLRGNPRIGIALLAIAVVVGTIGLLRPRSIRAVFLACSFATFPIGWFVSQLMLLTLFAIVITPVALLFKISGRDRLWRKRTPERPTYWKPRAPVHDVRRYLRQY